MFPDEVAVLVAGGGASGFMAAIVAAEAGVAGVHLLEATGEPLGKVRISGGGRCNVTHACWDPRSLVGHYPRGSKALRGPFARFASGDAVAWFADHGLELVEEQDGRLFPRSNSSESVVAVLRQAARRAGVVLHTGVALQQVSRREQGGFACRLRLAAAAGAGVSSLSVGCRCRPCSAWPCVASPCSSSRVWRWIPSTWSCGSIPIGWSSLAIARAGRC
jgi:hypothetical protein